MNFIRTTALKKILFLKKQLKIIQGGSSAGKTIGILLILIDRAQSEKNKVISIVSETIPHLKRGAIRDFINILNTHYYFDEKQWNRTDFIYTFKTGSIIEFFGADNFHKVRGPRRNILFINEANNLDFETYTQLSIRTSEEVYLDYNPVAEFWVHTEVMPKLEHDFIILTYKDNEALNESIIKVLEARKGRKDWWRVYGLGELGEISGKIYTNWKIIDEIPHEAKLVRYGLDFGYTNDPTAIVAIYYYNGGYILDEITFLKGLKNKQIADILLDQENTIMTVADSAEPKSIDEIKEHNVNIVGVRKMSDKGSKDSFVKWSIDLVQSQRISITKKSVNVIKEYRNYLWMVDRDEKVLNVPEHAFSHSMDAIRYGMVSLLGKSEIVKPDYSQKKKHNKYGYTIYKTKNNYVSRNL